MLIPVIDTETTGFEEPVEAVEFAAVCLDTEKRERLWEYTALCGVSKPIEIGALATHHITDKMIKNTMDLTGYLERTAEFGPIREAEFWVAHNAAYDGPIVDRALMAMPSFLNPRKPKWICTYRCAMHVWPDAPGHSNQVLRYFLGLPGPTSKLPPHRALPDAQVTAALLCRLLERHTPEQLYEMTSAPLLLRKVRFGKYRDELWADAVVRDPGYFRWVLGQDFDEDTKYTARFYLR